MCLRLFIILLAGIPAFVGAQAPQGDTLYPANVRNVLAKASTNRYELIKALNYYKSSKPGDSLRLKAMYFLVGNMDIHVGADYYWADSNKRRIYFNELDYPNFKESVNAFDSLKKVYGMLHPVPTVYRDMDVITAAYLIDNTERAFNAWQQYESDLNFNQFCEYILPYRASVEPLQNWRKEYSRRFTWLTDSSANSLAVAPASFLVKDINSWFSCMYDFELRTEPLPRLGAMQLLLRKKGFCEDIADLSVFALRSQGIGATTDIVPYWATSSGGHTFNFSIHKKQITRFDVLFSEDSSFKLLREPGKVYRLTYSKQPDALASLVDTAYIPHGLLRNSNLIDVTNEYWPTASLNAPLNSDTVLPPVVYGCVFNTLKWEPIAWTNKIINGACVFDNMSLGVVYLPKFYIKGQSSIAGFPIALGYKHTVELKPDTLTKRTITLAEQERYLSYQTGKKYRLYYWYGKWKLLSTQKIDVNTNKLVFYNVPRNALMLLLPEMPKNKERPFIVTDEGERIWF
jgi:hypothetical protein